MNPTKSFGALFLLFITLSISAPQAIARAPLSYSSPSQISVRMYWLTASGARREPYTLCASGHTQWGCTAFCNEPGYPCEGSQTLAYPYTTNPVNIQIETDYLLDVVPKEVSVEAFHPTAIQAQAIAARSYAYWHINQGSTINNSAQFQVFVPHAFEALPPTTFPDNPSNPCANSNLNADQHIVCNAVAPRYYIAYGTYSNDDLPAFTEYFADIRNRTVSGGQPYLIAVDDPISSHPDIGNDGHGHGLSQKGASRWARGDRSYNLNWDFGAWSGRWERAEQILVHYYTGIHIRDGSGTRLTPLYRWNPLRITWNTPDNRPPIMYHGGSYPMAIQVQNTSPYDWPINGQFWALSYHWAKAGFGETASDNRVWTTVDVPKGDPPYTFSLTINDIPNWGPGAYTLKFDMLLFTYGGTYWFSTTYGWPTYNVSICVDGPCKVFIPIVLNTTMAH